MSISTFSKQLFPIINSSNKKNREKSSKSRAVTTSFEIEIEIELGSQSSRVNGSRSARIGETSIHSFIFIQILVIDLDLTILNDSGRSTV